MSKRKFGIYIPSYKRAATISTHKLLEYYKVVVRKSEETEYLKVIPKENLIAVPDEEINNIVKVVNWIVDNSEEDAIAMMLLSSLRESWTTSSLSPTTRFIRSSLL